MIGILLGIAAIALGLKGFAADGLPLTSKKRLTGTGAKIVGGICLFVGLLFIADGIYAVYLISQRVR